MSCCYSDHLCNLVGHKAIIHTGCHCFNVLVCDITPCYIKVIDIRSGHIRIFNLDHIDFIEECNC